MSPFQSAKHHLLIVNSVEQLNDGPLMSTCCCSKPKPEPVPSSLCCDEASSGPSSCCATSSEPDETSSSDDYLENSCVGCFCSCEDCQPPLLDQFEDPDFELFSSLPPDDVLASPCPSTVTSGPDSVISNRSLEPNEYDIVCGRGKGSYNKPGNKKFRAIVDIYAAEYQQATTKLEKSNVLSKVLDHVKKSGNGGARFIAVNKRGDWYQVSDDQAREKVGHSIREAVAALAPERIKRKRLFEKKQNDLLTLQRSIFHQLVNEGRAQKRRRVAE